MSTPADRQSVSNLQDVFLNGARRERLRVTVRLMDGTEVCGRIKSFDRYALLVEHDESDVLLFKHAVATIRPRGSTGPPAGAERQESAGSQESAGRREDAGPRESAGSGEDAGPREGAGG
jgi:host factor-I protein